jgi:hypothetical protein
MPGRPGPQAGDFFGPPVNRAARIMAAAHGGQVLLSAFAAELAQKELPAETALRDLGEHRLKDLFQPEHIFQLVHPALTSEFPPLATLSHRPNNLPTQTSEEIPDEASLPMSRATIIAPLFPRRASAREADARTRTGDPFITSVDQVSPGVAPGRVRSHESDDSSPPRWRPKTSGGKDADPA